MSKNIKHTPLVVMDHDINFTGNLRFLAEPLKKTKLKLGGRSCLLIPGGFNTGACIHLIISKLAVFAKNHPASHVHVAIQPL